MTQTLSRKNLATLVLISLVFGFLAGQIFAADLTVSISANPDLGVGQLLGVDLTAVVSGSAMGNITYKFDCASDGVWDLTPAPTSQATYSAVDLCNYSSPGNYTATVRVERDVFAAQSTIAIIVDPQPKPTVDLKVNNSNGPVTIDYNTAASLTWTSTNATTCTATGDWLAAGAKAAQNTTPGESTGNLTSAKTYTITCSGPGGTSDPDSVTVYIKPTVDIKANNSDGPVTIDYNTAASLTWTSTNATACNATGDWLATGAKTISSAGESTGNLTSSKTYTITCSGLGGNSNPDSVTVNANPQKTLFVAVEPYPNVGAAPLNAVDFRATVTGTASGLITYRFDCTGDGSWEHEAPNQTANPYWANDICNYSSSGTYRPKFQVIRDGLTVNGNASLIVTSGTSTPTLFVGLSSQPSSGSAPLNAVLTASVAGTVTGNTTFTFDCAGDGIPDNTQTTSSVTANYTCVYSSAATYTARVKAERGGLTAQGNTIIIVQQP